MGSRPLGIQLINITLVAHVCQLQVPEDADHQGPYLANSWRLPLGDTISSVMLYFKLRQVSES